MLTMLLSLGSDRSLSVGSSCLPVLGNPAFQILRRMVTQLHVIRRKRTGAETSRPALAGLGRPARLGRRRGRMSPGDAPGRHPKPRRRRAGLPSPYRRRPRAGSSIPPVFARRVFRWKRGSV